MLLDGEPVLSCLLPAEDVEGRTVTTLETLTNLDAARAETLRLLGTEMPQGNTPTAQQGSGSAQSTPPKGEK